MLPKLPPIPDRVKNAGFFAWKQMALPLVMVVIGIVIFQPIEKWWTGEDKYIVYLVGNKNDGETQRIFRSVQQEAALAKLRFDGREIEVEEEDDKGQIETARAKASEIIADPRTLLVIGHVSGDVTKATLPQYMAASPRVPIITTRESTPSLLGNVQTCLLEHNYCPIIPLSPADDTQAETMLSFAIANGNRKFLILQEDDIAHKFYSEYLATALKTDLSKTPSVDYIDTLPVFATTSFSRALLTINSYKPSCIFYVGGPNTLIKFDSYLNQAVANHQLLQSDRPMLIASDGGVSEELLSRPGGGAIYLSHQLSSSEYQAQNHVYGVDAFAVVAQLVSQAGEAPDFHGVGLGAYMRHLINMHRVSDARSVLARIMEVNAYNATPYIGRKDRVYSYFGRYKRLNGYFHVWRLEGQKVSEADQHDGALSIASLSPDH